MQDIYVTSCCFFRAGGEGMNIAPLTGLLEGNSPVARPDDVSKAMQRRSINLKKCILNSCPKQNKE